MQDLIVKPILDFILPLGSVSSEGRFQLFGTAFLIGGRGFALTAAHVVEQSAEAGTPVVLFRKAEWIAVPIARSELHPTEDVAVMQLPDGEWHSLVEPVSSAENSSQRFCLWGYPDHVATELRNQARNADDAQHLVQPELVYVEGYVRRRISRMLEAGVYRGEAFYELSSVAGSCCSGAPCLLPHRAGEPFRAYGIYIGERTGVAQAMVGYATRLDALQDWTPDLLGNRLWDERATQT